jgi:hypothetical protein
MKNSFRITQRLRGVVVLKNLLSYSGCHSASCTESFAERFPQHAQNVMLNKNIKEEIWLTTIR